MQRAVLLIPALLLITAAVLRYHEGAADEVLLLTVATVTAESDAAAEEASESEGETNESGYASDPDQHWAYQPLQDHRPPEVDDVSWPSSPIDAFILRKLEQAGLGPSAPADKLALLRRVTFDLIGLPPTPEEIEAFLADDSPEAFAHVVDRLLESPHYGERWARHWLDLVRYGDTNGVVTDPVKPNAFRYRDYVIDAFNEDLPYDQFVREQIAGDLLPNPRMSRDGSHVASPIGSGFWWLGEIMHQLSDPTISNADELENQIDVFGKAFLGVTMACARCHDHKFDPISQEDYYALGGMLYSTTNVQVCLDTPAKQQAISTRRDRIAELRHELQTILADNDVSRRWREERMKMAQDTSIYLAAIREVLRGSEYPQRDDVIEVAERRGLDSERLLVWFDAVNNARAPTDPLFYAWYRLAKCPPEAFRRRARTLSVQWQASSSADGSPVTGWQDFEGNDFGKWKSIGAAFGDAPISRDVVEAVNVQGTKFASSSHPHDGLTGRLVSPSFTVDPSTRYLIFWVAGGADKTNTCVNLITHSGVRPQGFEWVATGRNSNQFEPVVWNLERFEGREVYIEVVDQSVGDWGHIMVDNFCFSAEPLRPPTLPPHRDLLVLLNEAKTHEELDAGYQALLLRALGRRDLQLAEIDRDDLLNDPDTLFLCWATEADGPLNPKFDLASLLSRESRPRWTRLFEIHDQLEDELPESTWAFVSRDRDEPDDMPLHYGGDPQAPGDKVRRAVPASLASFFTATPEEQSSGRLELADWVTSPDNPLTARVMVNRIWKHHFGRGLVATPDNFGQLGESPSHPELLDYLAHRFIESGWSIKAMHRLMLLSSTYQQSDKSSAEAADQDPDNLLLHHWSPRRLEAEAIRDAMACLAGALERRVYGPPGEIRNYGPQTPPFRRSIYLTVPRLEGDNLLSAFNFPKPASTVGQRYASRSPEQSLVILTHAFARTNARRWAKRIIAEDSTNERRISQLYREGLGRSPSETEQQAAIRFLEQQRQCLLELESSQEAERELELEAWTDLAHVMFNLEEFVTTH